MWHSSDRTHAYFIRPGSFYDPLQEGEKWSRNHEVCNLVGQDREVFHLGDKANEVKYAGTYHCLEVTELHDWECGQIPSAVRTNLTMSVVSANKIMPIDPP